MVKTIYQLELTRHNVTPSQFLSYVRSQCKKHDVPFDLSLDDFARESDFNSRYNFGVPGFHGAFSEICQDLAYDKQTYILCYNGDVYNEIVEFQFWDDKRWFGYFYTIEAQATGDTTEEELKLMRMAYDYYSREIERRRQKIESILADIEKNGKWYYKGFEDIQRGKVQCMEYEIRDLSEMKDAAERRISELNPTAA